MCGALAVKLFHIFPGLPPAWVMLGMAIAMQSV
jgi:hypothetical protein